MSAASLFSLSGNAFVLAWLTLLVGALVPRHLRARRALLAFGGRLVPIALLLVFLAGVFAHHGAEPRGNMFTYQGMLLMLSVPERLLNIWIEVLALALFACRWMIDDAGQRGINRAAVAVCLLVAFVSGGLGLLCYAALLLLRHVSRRAQKSPASGGEAF